MTQQNPTKPDAAERGRQPFSAIAVCSISCAPHGKSPVTFCFMTRRTDFQTAEKLSLALMTRAAFGDDAGVRTALLSGIAAQLVERVFSRDPGLVRRAVHGLRVADRRREPRKRIAS